MADAKIAGIAAMMETMVRRFAAEHGLAPAPPPALSLERYRREIDAIEAICAKQFGTAALLVTSRGTLLERFFDTIASRVKFAFREANGDAEAWLQVVMAPLQAQMRRHRDQLRHRQASLRRILDATGGLEQKSAAFEAAQHDLVQVKARLANLSGAVADALRADLPALRAA